MQRALCQLAIAAMLTVAVGLVSPAQAAEGSIDCGKAEAPDEKAICADRTLIQDDARMATLYAAAMSRSGMGERGDLQDGQTAWLEQRHACKADVTCIGAAYEARIGRLQKVIDAASSRDPF